jgi:S-methyl-5-thioribose-1-phosphate isomerase/adenine phosphoribosyltransferase
MTYSLRWTGDAILVVDQRRLPGELTWICLKTVDDVVDAITSMAIRGAPAIGIAGAMGVALSALENLDGYRADEGSFRTDVARLGAARPTAVNLRRAVDRAARRSVDGPQAVVDEAVAMLAEDEQINRVAARHAADLLIDLCEDRPLRILTHCNTGRLATAAWGTALGAIADLAGRGRVDCVLVCETRPLLQGARLTTWELDQLGIRHRLCVDSAAAAAMSRGLVDCVVVGADRVTANGDVANKIGTYGLAAAAARHGLPFVVVAPDSTVDRSLLSGDQIQIEERDPAEVTTFGGVATAPATTDAFNPAFDVTPAELVTAVVTEGGVSPFSPVPTGDGVDLRLSERIGRVISSHHDFPRPDVRFRDLGGLYADPGLLADVVDALVGAFDGTFDAVLAIEAPGLALGTAIAQRCRTPLVLARKEGRLPSQPHQAGYRPAYGEATLCLQKGALRPADRVLLVDDVLATGVTLSAAAGLVEASAATVAGLAVLLVLNGLPHAARIADYRLVSLREEQA